MTQLLQAQADPLEAAQLERVDAASVRALALLNSADAVVAQAGGTADQAAFFMRLQLRNELQTWNRLQYEWSEAIGRLSALEVQSSRTRSQALEAAAGRTGVAVDRVTSGRALVRDAGATMSEIVDAVQQVCRIVEDIAVTSAEQNDRLGQVNRSVAALQQMTLHNAALVDASKGATDALGAQAGALSALIGGFRLQPPAA